MNPSTSLERIISAAIPRLADSARPLSETAKHVQSARQELVSSWRGAQIAQSPRADASPLASGEFIEQAVDIWLIPLDATDLNLQACLERAAAWSAELYEGGFDLADQTALWTQMRRALMPFLVRWHPVGPELDQTLAAFDVLERAVLGVVAAVGIHRAQEQLAEGIHLRAVGRLTGGLAHALNNAMAVIVGRAQILQEQAADAAFANDLRDIQKTARSSAEALKLLQIFSSDWDGEAVTRLDVNELVHQVIEVTRFRWRDDAEANGIAIEVIRDLTPVPPVIGRAGALRDALVELVLNAVEAMPSGGQLTIQTAPADDKVRIVIADQGSGMESHVSARALEPYFTTKGTGHAGLGLMTVADSVRQMGGTLTLESTAGAGTTAILRLPVALPIHPAADNLAARLVRWAKILIVDDEPLVLDVTARTFALRGFRVVTAASGEEALRAVREQGAFEVALVDLGMPGMNGFQTAHAIKALYPRTLVILMTGWAAELDAAKLREAGIDRAITKPFAVAQVIQLISEGLALQEKI